MGLWATRRRRSKRSAKSTGLTPAVPARAGEGEGEETWEEMARRKTRPCGGEEASQEERDEPW